MTTVMQTGLLRCGVLAFLLAVAFPAKEAKATSRVDEFRFLSAETTRAIEKELGIDLFYMFGINRQGVFVIGVPPDSAIESFENQFELWQTKRKIVVKEIQDLNIIRYRVNPIEQCFPYPAFGSIRWYCITLPD